MPRKTSRKQYRNSLASTVSALTAELPEEAALLAARFELIGSMLGRVTIPLSVLTDILRAMVVLDHIAGFSLDNLRAQATRLELELMTGRAR